MRLELQILKDVYAVYRFGTDSDIPDWIYDSDFYSITKTKDELSIVCKQNDTIDKELAVNENWRTFKIHGPLDFSLIGIIAEISRILKESNISILTVSTYDTDYILVKSQYLNQAIDSLEFNGHHIVFES